MFSEHADEIFGEGKFLCSTGTPTAQNKCYYGLQKFSAATLLWAEKSITENETLWNSTSLRYLDVKRKGSLLTS